MRYQITHITTYEFSRPVYLEPHLLRFQPRSDGAQIVTRHALTIDPEPQGVSAHLDAEGNAVSRAWFVGMTDQITFSAVSEVEAKRQNPFDYLLTDANIRLPVAYRLEIQPVLSAAQRRAHLPGASDPVMELARSLAADTGQEVSAFLLQLSQHIHSNFEIFRRDEGPPWSPAQTFERRAGACRDVAWLFVDACRSVGLAARFVSGYQAGPDEQLRHELHAWAEAYIPGAGWRGYDATQGLAVTDAHVAAAASIDPAGTYPVAGTFRGTGASSRMSTRIDVVTSEITAS